jgi:hypothetical protein
VLILLSPASVYQPEKLKGVLLFIASKDEYLTKGLKSAYNKAPAPKTYKLIPGSAHAQHIFKTPQADTLTAPPMLAPNTDILLISGWLCKNSTPAKISRYRAFDCCPFVDFP